MAKIWRYEVPIDDQWHEFELAGQILHVGCRESDVMEFWAEHLWEVRPDAKGMRYQLRVFRTGQDLGDPRPRYIGTAVSPNGHFAWHLMEHIR